MLNSFDFPLDSLQSVWYVGMEVAKNNTGGKKMQLVP